MAPIWEDLASILSKRFHSFPFHAHHVRSIPFHLIARLRARASSCVVARTSARGRITASGVFGRRRSSTMTTRTVKTRAK